MTAPTPATTGTARFEWGVRWTWPNGETQDDGDDFDEQGARRTVERWAGEMVTATLIRRTVSPWEVAT